jgi:hypothetical protein
MDLSSTLLDQLTDDRHRDRQAAAAVERLADRTPARRRIAQSLRRAADRLDGNAVSARADSAGAESARAPLSAGA